MKYLEIVQPSDIRANGIFLSIDEDFQYYGFTKYSYTKQTVVHGSDGAIVRVCVRKGVVKLLKLAGDAPWEYWPFGVSHKSLNYLSRTASKVNLWKKDILYL